MDKLHTQTKNEDHKKSELFKQLFLFQTELVRYDDDRFKYQANILELIHEIDELLQLLIDETDSYQLE